MSAQETVVLYNCVRACESLRRSWPWVAAAAAAADRCGSGGMNEGNEKKERRERKHTVSEREGVDRLGNRREREKKTGRKEEEADDQKPENGKEELKLLVSQ